MQDKQRISEELFSRQLYFIEYSVPGKDVLDLKDQLEGLLSQNNALISQAKNAANQVNNATVL